MREELSKGYQSAAPCRDLQGRVRLKPEALAVNICMKDISYAYAYCRRWTRSPSSPTLVLHLGDQQQDIAERHPGGNTVERLRLSERCRWPGVHHPRPARIGHALAVGRAQRIQLATRRWVQRLVGGCSTCSTNRQHRPAPAATPHKLMKHSARSCVTWATLSWSSSTIEDVIRAADWHAWTWGRVPANCGGTGFGFRVRSKQILEKNRRTRITGRIT